MAITKKLVPIEEGAEVPRQVEIYDSSIPTRIIDEESLKLEKENLEQQTVASQERIVEIDKDLAIIDTEEAKGSG